MTDNRPAIDIPPAVKRGSALALMVAAIIAVLITSGRFTPEGDVVVTRVATFAALATVTPTERPTPTSMAGNPTSGGIIEVTPLGGGPMPAPAFTPTPPWGYPVSFLEAYYTPKYQMKIRNAASFDGVVVGYLAANMEVRIYGEVFLTARDVWVCLDAAVNKLATPMGSDCQKAVAYKVTGHEDYGVVRVVKP